MNPEDVRQQWEQRSGEFSPRYYAYYGPDGTSESLRERLDAAVDPDASILELGCSSGRHLAHLRDHGYDDLHGIELNGEAFDVMADAYPELAADGTFYHGAIEDVVPEFEDRRFDAVYSVETLQHVHPDDEWVFGELARIADDLLVTVEIEESDRRDDGTDHRDDGADHRDDGTDHRDDGADRRDDESDTAVCYVDEKIPLYHRNWGRVFADHDLVEVEAVELDRDTLRAFRPGDGR